MSDFTSNYRAEVTTWTTLAGSSQTDLSSALAPPLESAPRFFNPNAEGNPWEAIGCLFIAAIIPFGFIVEGLTNGWNPYLGFFALACVLVWLYVAGQFSLHLEARRIYIARQPLRDLIWYEWNRLYFCHRCDGVFLPEEGRLVASTQMPAYVTELAEVEMAANR